MHSRCVEMHSDHFFAGEWDVLPQSSDQKKGLAGGEANEEQHLSGCKLSQVTDAYHQTIALFVNPRVEECVKP